MSDDKKFTLDDILNEYDRAAEKDGEKDPSSDENDVSVSTAENGAEEEYDNYEDGEEQDISENFSPEPEFVPAELFENAVKEEKTETSEELFADEESKDTEVPEELIEEEKIKKDDIGVLTEDKDMIWSDSLVSDAAEDIPYTEEDMAATEEKTDVAENDVPVETVSADSENAADDPAEDVNDKWIVRFLKGIFPVKGDSVGEVIRKIIFLAAMIVFIGAGIMLVSTLIQSKKAIDIKEEAGSVIMTTVATTIDENGNVITIAPTKEEEEKHNFDVAAYYKKINEDYVGYLEVEGCDIYEPVVQGDDNDYYLKTNISGGYNKAGTVFMDYRCTVSQDYTSPNVVLYGHNQEDGTMFGNLKWYKNDPEFYSEHPVVKFSSEYETGTYLIYGYFVTHVYANQDSNGEVFHYHDYIETLNDEATFNWYIKEVMNRNQIVTPVDVKFGDKLLCLSTCSNEFSNSRFVVFARKLRDGESVEDFDFSEAYINYNAESVDWDAIMSGETTMPPETEISEEPEIIDEDEEDDESSAPVVRYKSNDKKNSGSGAKSDDRRLIPPAPVETTVTEETTAKKKKTETSETEETTAKKKKTETSETEETTTKKKKSKTSETEETTVKETTAKKKKTTPETSESAAETETFAESENAVTEAPPQEEGTETEVPTVQ